MLRLVVLPSRSDYFGESGLGLRLTKRPDANLSIGLDGRGITAVYTGLYQPCQASCGFRSRSLSDSI